MNFTDLLSVFVIALGLSADCFAVSLGVGASGKEFSWKSMLRVALAFGLFQMGMPLLGWLIGQTVVQYISNYDHWIAFALLAFIGVRMAWEFIKGESESKSVDITRWPNLIATSIDVLAVGLSFAFLHINIWIAAAIIGIVAFSVTAVSYWLGRKVSAWIGRWALLLGAVVLIGIGVRILVTHWTA
ncbi:MAG: manganese efflux pump MntP family protein [Chloroflexi bacterium]|nr:manganese efflux pump MntP family protein [Chloroflexota bacterium]